MLEGRSLHYPRTTVMVLSGAGAVAKANPAWLSAVLCGPGGLPADNIGELYRFENPTRWFCTASETMSRGMYDSLHGRVIKVPGTDITLMCEHVDKERTRITVHWLPTTYPPEAVKAVVGALTGDEDAEVFKMRNREGQWGALCHPTKEIPHYASVEAPGRPNGWHTIKVTIPGRLTACQHCGQTEHWSNKCPSRKQRNGVQQVLSVTEFPPLGEIITRKEGKAKESRVDTSPTKSANPLKEKRGGKGKKVSGKVVDHEVPDESLTHSEEEESQQTAQTQTEGGQESVRSVREEQEEREEEDINDGFELVIHNKNLKRKLRERSQSRSPQGTKSLRTCSSSSSGEEGEINSYDEGSETDTQDNMNETKTQYEKTDEDLPLTFADILRQTNC